MKYFQVNYTVLFGNVYQPLELRNNNYCLQKTVNKKKSILILQLFRILFNFQIIIVQITCVSVHAIGSGKARTSPTFFHNDVLGGIPVIS